MKIKFEEGDMWSADITIAKVVYKILRRFRKETDGGYPADLTSKEWKKILKKMTKAFKKIADGDADPFVYDEEVKEGLELFSKYMCALWY